MKVLVCGGRDFGKIGHLRLILDLFYSNVTCIISGMAKGADLMAAEWAIENQVDLEDFPADWKTHGKAAGPIRNQAMLDKGEPDLVIAFPGGRGTADMVKRARAADVPVLQVLV